MALEKKLSLPAAILININIMLGGGIFINTVELAKRTGFLSSFMYPLMGLLIIPLILVITQLLKIHPSGGFYIFAKEEISPFAGFVSTWSYFIAKLASAMLMIHISLSLIMQIFPILQHLGSVYFFDFLVLTLFIFLNTLNLKTGSHIQMGFLTFKLLPVLFVIGAGSLWFFSESPANFQIIWDGIPSSIPLVLYAAMGFEAICALSNQIKDGERNGPKSIFISVTVVMTLVFLFQFFFYYMLGTNLAAQTNYLGAFPTLLHTLFPMSPILVNKLHSFFHFAIALSALGGCYGILYSNNWNLYILAQHKHIFFSPHFLKLNRHTIPIICLLAEWAICIIFLIITAGSQLSLQQTAALGTAITYTMCVLALWFRYAKLAHSWKEKIIPTAGFFSCAILITACMRNFLISGIAPLLGFFILLAGGLVMYGITKQKH